MSDPTAYDFSGLNLFAFSDEEGGAPFKFDRDVADAVVGPDQGIPELLRSTFTINGEGIITDMAAGNALAFLGDLVDNEAHSIRVLSALVDLKKRKPREVLLIGGNRDYNKIRMGIELYLEADDGTLPWAETESFADLLTKLQGDDFHFRKQTVPEYLVGVKLWDDNLADLQKAYVAPGKNFNERLTIMFSKTLGVNIAKGDLVREINTIFGSGLSVGEELTAKVLCVVQMAMSYNWTAADLPEYFRTEGENSMNINGLYLQYIEQSHAIAMFQMNGKLGVMSHGGLPQAYIKGAALDKRALTSPMGFYWETPEFTPSTLSVVIANIEKEKDALLEEMAIVKETGYEVGVNKIIDKFIHTTAGTNLKNYDAAKNPYGKNSRYASTEGEHARFGAYALNSPVVGFQAIDTQARRNILVQRGGTWIDDDLAKAEKLYVADGDDIIHYNIYGHAPQGFHPTAYREAQTLHVCLDVSKIDGAANNYSFAFLHVTAADTNIIGRIKFPAANANNVFEGAAAEFADKIVYYSQPVTADGPYEFLKAAAIPGCNVKFEQIMLGPGKFGPRKFTKAAAGGGRRRTRKARKGRKATRRRRL